jgi:hyperosmotically inducible periplasmic protein
MKIFHTLALIAAGTVLVTSTSLCASETDDRIESSFHKSYAYKIYLKDDAIKTESKNGVVTLSGQVNEASHRDLAQETVAGFPGVQRVDNRLEVKLEGTEKSDTWIRAKVRSVLALHRNVSGSRTEVDIRDGVITLRGGATSEAQKELATEYAEDVKGVLRVTNMMTVVKIPAKATESVVETIDDASITAQVRVALLSHHSTSSVHTKVGTTNGVVTVSGMAKNAAEKALVTKLATDIIGVKSVVNNMTIAPTVSENVIRPARVENLRVASTRD